MAKHIAPEEHKCQIDCYTAEQPKYRIYANALERILRNACAVSIPEAFVQARAKTVSSFAEKCARKFHKYSDACHQLTDLCGVRVIVQTLEQVQAVRQFIEANFAIIEKEDKGLLLGTDEFGYRDMHYIVQVRAGPELGFTADELNDIGERKAEIQVRTWVQHAWADTLHDRMYKTKLKFSNEVKRTGALLAAIMENGDREFNRLANEVDGMLANYTAYTPKQQVMQELEIQELILKDEPEPGNRPALALQLARLNAACGEYEKVVKLLEPYARLRSPLRCELLLELGYALCKVNRMSSNSEDYRGGQMMLEEVVAQCEFEALSAVPNLRKTRSVHARALARLAWSWEIVRGAEYRARDYYQRALEKEPANPYFLADVLGFEIFSTHAREMPVAMRATIRTAIETCREHGIAGIEMPYACFTAGRLHLLLRGDEAAIGCYARGLAHVRSGTYCVPQDVIETEVAWLQRVNFGHPLEHGHRWGMDLLNLSNSEASNAGLATNGSLSAPVLVIAGGADGMSSETVRQVQFLLRMALKDFSGTIISGGTMSGVPLAIGEVAMELAKANTKRFRLIGYLPAKLPRHTSEHQAYDEHRRIGDDFSLEQVDRYWVDLLNAGIAPRDVLLLGFGGGRLSGAEYRVALGLGSSVGLVMGTGGSADELIADPVWSGIPNLLPLPPDASTVRAFVTPSASNLEGTVLEEMAKSFHAEFVANSAGRLPANMKPWPKLNDTFKRANCEQAKYVVQILEAQGFGVRSVAHDPAIFSGFTAEEIEHMAEMEHGRWNIERLRDGWRPGRPRDDARKIHDCLVPWSDLSDETKPYDRFAARKFPIILAQAGLEVFRR